MEFYFLNFQIRSLMKQKLFCFSSLKYTKEVSAIMELKQEVASFSPRVTGINGTKGRTAEKKNNVKKAKDR